MRTVQIERYIHEEASDAQIARWEKSHQKGSLPPRGPRCGVMVARVVDDQHYVIGVSLVNPGHHIKGGKLVGFDKFDQDIAVKLALANIFTGAPLPGVLVKNPTTHRSRNLHIQFAGFMLQVKRVFKDKLPRTAAPSAV